MHPRKQGIRPSPALRSAYSPAISGSDEAAGDDARNGREKPRLSRGVSPRRSDEQAFLDGVVAAEHETGPRREDAMPPARNYGSIAVVVGRPAAQNLAPRPSPPRPSAPRPSSPPKQSAPKQSTPKPSPQRAVQRNRDQLPAVSRAPLIDAAEMRPVARTASSSLVTLKRAYGAVFNPDSDRAEELAAQDGFKAYLLGSFENQRRTGARVLAIALLLGGGWATLMPLSGAVVLPGTVVAESSVKKIQHQTGGVVAGIAVTEGMRVREGDILVRLDDTQVRSTYEQLRSRIAQLNEQIGGMTAQIKTRETESGLIAQELKGVQTLWEKQLVPLTRLTSLQRDAARIDGEKAQLVSSVAETRGKINEAELQLAAAKEQVNHIDLRAPVSGVVHQLSVHTVGGVVTPAEVMMVIVPESDELQIEAHLPPDQIDQVHKGQNAMARFPAFNQRTTPELAGIVTHVSADITRDQQQPNSGYYTVRVSLPGEELARLGDRHLVAGMPAELFIQTGSRTMLSYMFKPITEQLNRMFRER
jgi:multidrug efflux pump subunit AcrA (membrane-fusion protein)